MNGAVRFVAGAFGGAFLALIGGMICVWLFQAHAESENLFGFKSHQEIEGETWQRLGPKVVVLVMLGGIVGGATAAILGSNSAGARRSVRRRRTSHPLSSPLEQTEYDRIFSTCAWVGLHHKSPDYLQGFVVGRFAESDPGLARRVDEFDDVEMDLLCSKMKRRKDRMTRASGH